MKNTKNITSKTLKWTLLAASREFVVGRETLRRRLARCGFESDAAGHYTTLQIFEALSGSLEKSRIRESKARTRLLEMEGKEKSGALFPLDGVLDYLRDTWQPVRETVIPMADVLAPLVNPSDPEHARTHLLEWRDEFFKRCTLKLPELIKAREETTAPDKL